ncbi:hypothetical protein HanPI659440_Chr13g0505081 [Helianthus annuus]|nr:hypothetical protein HanPI659440_Chr13g0505081 [Helianthus annuus]
MFRRLFRLAKIGDWFTFETSQIDVSLISSLVTTLGSWKDRFFWVSESVIPFKMVWRHPDAVLNELEPSESGYGTEVEGRKELSVVTGKKGKSSGKKAVVFVAGGSSERSGEEPVGGMLRMFMSLFGRLRLGTTSSPPLSMRTC